MKTLRNLFVLALVLSSFVNISVFAGSTEEKFNEGKDLAKQAYLKYDKDLMLNAMKIFDEIYSKDKANINALYYTTLIQYKLVEMGLQKDDEELFDKYYDEGLKNAGLLSSNKNFEADGKTLLAGIYMMKIASSPMSAVTLSPKVHSLLDEAQQIAPGKPYSYVIRGIMKYNTPGIFGGSYEDALSNFNQAVKLFEKDEDVNSLNPVWGYPETLAWAGRALEELDNNEAARFTYKKALNEEDEFAWVKYVLLPELEKKISENN